MKRKIFSRALIAAAACLAVALPVVAQSDVSDTDAPSAFSQGRERRGERHAERHTERHRGRRDGERREVPEAVRLHLDLGRYYMLDQDYAAARDHYLAVARLEPADRDEQSREGRRGRGERGRTHAYLMAAVSSVLAGDVPGGVAIAEEGEALIPACLARGAMEDEVEGSDEDVPRRSCRLVEFLNDPEGFSAEFAGGAADLEVRLLAIETPVDENAAE